MMTLRRLIAWAAVLLGLTFAGAWEFLPPMP